MKCDIARDCNAGSEAKLVLVKGKNACCGRSATCLGESRILFRFVYAHTVLYSFLLSVHLFKSRRHTTVSKADSTV